MQTGDASVDAAFIRASKVARAYFQGGTRNGVLQNLCFSLRRGETVALLGRSGSGKTTLLNLLSGIDRPDAGQLWV
ncbi:MAG TPA: ATP-binding cassette domain-containing protein, partial [Pseudomonadaceae bacterium]|nr:ATP-binding cassette domain-containing protein [Pseudomonadaceae bacterium]